MSFTITGTPTNSPTPAPTINYNDEPDYYYIFMFFVFLFCLCPKICFRFQRNFRFRRNRVYYDIENARYNFSSRLIPMTQINNEQCCICLDDLSNEHEVVLIDTCLHPYHKHCINEWLNVNPICPICRRDILN